MAVHFDFILDDADAENIFFALRHDALNNDINIMRYTARTDLTDEQKQSYIEWFNENREYKLDLITKMTNTRVPE